jgi:hypothetical protein
MIIKRSYKLILLLLGFGGVLCFLLLLQMLNSGSKLNNELSQKPFWAALQSAEFSRRDELVSTLPIVKSIEVSGHIYRVLVAKTENREHPYAWTILDPGLPAPILFSIPMNVPIATTCSDIERIITAEKVSASVKNFLSGACQEQIAKPKRRQP